MELIKIKGGKKPAITCDPATLVGCNEKEQEFAGKFKSAPVANVEAELKRLRGMTNSSMKPEQKAFLLQRISILEKLVATAGKKEL